MHPHVAPQLYACIHFFLILYNTRVIGISLYSMYEKKLTFYQNIFFCVRKNEESHTGLETHGG